MALSLFLSSASLMCHGDPGDRRGCVRLCGSSLVLARMVTAIAIVTLFVLFRGGRITGRRLSWASLLYLLFEGALGLA
jgi:hypothetical protein